MPLHYYHFAKECALLPSKFDSPLSAATAEDEMVMKGRRFFFFSCPTLSPNVEEEVVDTLFRHAKERFTE